MLDYIENNITEKLETSELAKLENYSSVQFTRNFVKATGYTPAQYITKRKLYFSAWDLLNTNEKIVDIAMRYNFECHDTFSRAFKRFFGKTPEFFRRKGFHVPEFSRPLDNNEPNEPYNRVEIVTLPEIKLIGVERRFRASEQSFEVFDRIYDDVFKNVPNRVYPNSRNATHVLSIIQPNGDFTIFSGIEVTDFDDVPKNADRYILPEQVHAMLWLSDDDGVEYRNSVDFLYLKWLGSNMNEFQSGQTEAYPIATVEYFVPNELRTQTNPQTEAVYVPINPVVAEKETLEQRRVYSLTIETEHNLTIYDRGRKEEIIQKMLDIITDDCGICQKSYEIILSINKNSCEVMWVTDTIVNYSDFCEKTFQGGEFLKVETCNRCPHIAQSVFMRILEQSNFTTDNIYEIYHVSGNSLLTLTPMSLLSRGDSNGNLN